MILRIVCRTCKKVLRGVKMSQCKAKTNFARVGKKYNAKTNFARVGKIWKKKPVVLNRR